MMTPCHIAVEGLGEVGNGALHPFVTPSHALVIVATGLLLGQRLPLRLKAPMSALALGSAAGLLATTSGWPQAVPPPLLLGIALAIAAWVAIERNLVVSVLAAIAAAAGFVIGLDSAPEAASSAAFAKTLLGTWLGINAAVGYLAICTSHAEGRPWARIAIRVAASWIIAITLLVLAFAMREQPAGADRKPPCDPHSRRLA